MRRTVHFAGVLVGTLALACTLSGQPRAPWFGTWKLNLAKSDFGLLPLPRSVTATVERIGDAAKRTIINVSADGTSRTEVDTVKFDGKEYPHTGSPVYDSYAMKRIDAKKDGKVVATNRQTLSKDGKVYTVMGTRRAANGQPSFKIVEVFDKQ